MARRNHDSDTRSNTADRQSEDARHLSESKPSNERTRPLGFVGWIVVATLIGVVVIGLLALAVLGVAFITEGVREMVTQTAVTHQKHDPTPIPLTGAMAILNGAAFAALGSLFVLPSLLLIRALWKKRSAQQANRLDERNA